MPDANVGADVNIVRRGWIDAERVVFDVEKISARRTRGTTAHFPARAIEMPDAPRIANSAETDINGIERSVAPIDRDIGNQSLQA